MSVASIRQRVNAARQTLENTNVENTIPHILAALEDIAKTLEEIEKKLPPVSRPII